MTSRPLTYISTSAALSTALKRISRNAPREGIAIDTEGSSLYRYRDQVSLVQISTREEDFILDPLALPDLSPLSEVLSESVAILHGADYDVIGLRRDFSLKFSKIFDTMIAAQLLGYPQVSLAALVEARCGVLLSKKHQRDDWGKRPLSPSMLQYARQDTQYLHQLRDSLTAELHARDLWDAAEEEFEVVAERAPSESSFAPEDFLKIKGARQLSQQAQGVLCVLYCWREEEAETLDIPPFKVLRNETLFLLAERRPRNVRALSRIPGITPTVLERYEDILLTLIREAPPWTPLPKPPRRPFPGKSVTSAEEKELLERLKEWREKTAERLKIPLSFVAPTAFLEAIIKANPSTKEELLALPGARRWRVRRFGDEILRHLSSPDF